MPRCRARRSSTVPARTVRRIHTAVFASLLLLAVAAGAAGCGKAAQASESYFAVVEGNRWLYRSEHGEESLEVEIKVVRPDPALRLRPGIYDISITGSLGETTVSEQGLFVEVSPKEVKLWGVRQTGETPRFFSAPYIWLGQPLEVGNEYNTAIQGAPTPALMAVTGKKSVSTPWGAMEGFVLQEKLGTGVAGGVVLEFVPYLGFTRIATSEWPEFVLENASLR